MSDTPSPLPESTKPKLSLAPKAPAAAETAPTSAPAPTLSAPPPTLAASNSNATPAGLAAAASSGAPRAALKLQGNVHPANPDKFADAKFNSPIPAAADDAPSPAIVALSALAAVAAISFAVLLFLKNQ